MKFAILTLGFLASFSVFAQAGDLKQRFLDTTSLKEGYYQLVQGPQSCLEGPVRILEVDQELTLMVGAHPLIMGLGQPSSLVQEAGCKTSTSAEFAAGKVKGSRSEVCKTTTLRFVTEVQVQDQSLTYKRKVFERNKVRVDEVCVLKLKAKTE